MRPGRLLFSLLLMGFIGAVSSLLLYPLDPPTKEQVEKYKRDGTLKSRVEQARSFGNHRMSPYLIARFKERLGIDPDAPADHVMAPPPAWEGMQATGNVKIPVILISFEDYTHVNSPSLIWNKIFGMGESSEYPLESLKEFYKRSSYGKLNITGNVLGWYRYPGTRADIQEESVGRESLIIEALQHYESKGHDFSQYDNDHDGDIDYLVVIWSGPRGDWSSFWWAYQTSFYNRGTRISGKTLSLYSWQWESKRYPGDSFKPSTLIHETGHALGLPDLYDYLEGTGPEGGVGGMDIMDNIWGDHNAFHKYMLGWCEPVLHRDGPGEFAFDPAVIKGESLMIMPEFPSDNLFGEFFMIENRSRTGNDIEIPGDGLIIWHIDSTLTKNGRDFEYDNSYTGHKYIRLMEADGLEEIEQMQEADEGDFYTTGGYFSPSTSPGSVDYRGDNTGIFIKDILIREKKAFFRAEIDIPVELDIEGERKQETAWIVVSDYADIGFTFRETRESGLSGFIIMKKLGSYEYEELMRVGINEVDNNFFSLKDPGLKKQGVYYYKVIAVDGSGNVLGISREIKI